VQWPLSDLRLRSLSPKTTCHTVDSRSRSRQFQSTPTALHRSRSLGARRSYRSCPCSRPQSTQTANENKLDRLLALQSRRKASNSRKAVQQSLRWSACRRWILISRHLRRKVLEADIKLVTTRDRWRRIQKQYQLKSNKNRKGRHIWSP